MDRNEYFKRIDAELDYWVFEVGENNQRSNTDINRCSEGFLAKLLTLVYDEHYVDLNRNQSNFPGVDLGCYNRKIAYQVSAKVDSKKILDTYKKVKSNYSDGSKTFTVFETFDKIRFLEIARPKRKHHFSDSTMDKIKIESNDKFKMSHIEDVNDIVEKIKALYDTDSDRFLKIEQLITENIGYTKRKINDKANDNEVLTVIFECLDRPAFTTTFYRECSLGDFFNALKETISLIKTGRKNDQDPIVKLNINNITSKEIRDEVSELVDGIHTLRHLALKMNHYGYISEEDILRDDDDYRDHFTYCGDCINDLRDVVLSFAKQIAEKENVRFPVTIHYDNKRYCFKKKSESKKNLNDQLLEMYKEMKQYI